MKINKLIFALLLVLMGLFALQSCTKDNTTFKVYGSFSKPSATAPLTASEIYITSNTVDLKWATTDSDGDVPKCDVYFGTTDKPGLYKKAHNSLTLNVPVLEGKTYYWYVIMTDANNIQTKGDLFSFAVLAKWDINKLVGLFDCDEPGYKHYDCNFTKVGSNTITNDNFWDSGYAVNYVFDSNGNAILTPVTYTGGAKTYDITGDGAFDIKTGGLVIHYVVKNHATGAVEDDNTHTFIKK